MSITAANALIVLTVPLVLPSQVQLQGFAADDVSDSDDVEMAATLMGVDGKLSGGFVYAGVPWTITFQADSPSIPYFEAWDAAQQAASEVFPGQATLTLTAVNRSYQMVTGFLDRGKRIADIKRTLVPRKFRIMWQRVIAQPVGNAG